MITDELTAQLRSHVRESELISAKLEANLLARKKGQSRADSNLIITSMVYRKSEKWAWIALVTGLMAFNAIQMVVSYMITGGVLHNVLWMCPGLVILLLPVKDFLNQKASPASAD